MAKRAMVYCPQCRNVGITREELFLEMPENDRFRCKNGHNLDREQLLALNPDLIKLEYIEKPEATWVKAEFFVDPIPLAKFRERYPNRQHSTINSILTICMNGDPVIIDGIQALKLREMNIRNGAEVLAAIEVTHSLESEIEGLKTRISILKELIKSGGGDDE